jgi:D-arabinose 1-dehydrogenase-like Zn-dependent alcohol dehydrogenase
MGMRTIVIDTGDEREKLAKDLGAEHFIDFKKEDDPVKKAVEITEGGAHGVFVTAVQTYPAALGYLGTRGGGKLMW